MLGSIAVLLASTTTASDWTVENRSNSLCISAPLSHSVATSVDPINGAAAAVGVGAVYASSCSSPGVLSSGKGVDELRGEPEKISRIHASTSTSFAGAGDGMS